MISRTRQNIPADNRAPDAQESLMNISTTFITNSQSAKLMQPRQRALNDPAANAQASAMFLTPAGQQRADTPLTQFIPVWLRIITAISLNQFRLWAWSSSFASDAGDRIHQGHQLSHIMTIGPRQEDGQGNTACIRDDMMFAPQLPSIRWIRARLRPPKTARTDPLSTTARDQSILSASWRRDSKTSCNFCQTPAFSQARKYRQHVILEPQPIAWGNISQGIPLRNTNKIPVNTARRSFGLRPGYRFCLRFGLGNNGSRIFHNSSFNNSLAIVYPSLLVTLRLILASCYSFSVFLLEALNLFRIFYIYKSMFFRTRL
jgi:hypothetical protein